MHNILSTTTTGLILIISCAATAHGSRGAECRNRSRNRTADIMPALAAVANHNLQNHLKPALTYFIYRIWRVKVHAASTDSWEMALEK